MQSSASISAADYQNCASLGRGETARYGANGREPARPAHQYQLTSKTATGSAKSALQSGCQYCYVKPVRQNNAPIIARAYRYGGDHREVAVAVHQKSNCVSQPLEYLADSVNVTSKRCFRTTRRLLRGDGDMAPSVGQRIAGGRRVLRK